MRTERIVREFLISSTWSTCAQLSYCLKHFPMVLLLGFPADIACRIIFEWFDAKSICRLDSACCSTEFRAEFISHLSSEHCVRSQPPLSWGSTNFLYITTSKKKGTRAFYDWALNRQLKVSSLEVGDDTESTVQANYLHMTGRYIKALLFWKLRWCNKMDKMTSHHLPYLQEINCYRCHLNIHFRGLLQICAISLRKISLRQCNIVASQLFAGIKCALLFSVATDLHHTENNIAMLSMSDHITHLKYEIRFEAQIFLYFFHGRAARVY